MQWELATPLSRSPSPWISPLWLPGNQWNIMKVILRDFWVCVQRVHVASAWLLKILVLQVLLLRLIISWNTDSILWKPKSYRRVMFTCSSRYSQLSPALGSSPPDTRWVKPLVIPADSRLSQLQLNLNLYAPKLWYVDKPSQPDP